MLSTHRTMPSTRRVLTLASLLAALALLVSGCAISTTPAPGAGDGVVGAANSPSAKPKSYIPTQYDITPLLDPSHKYFGAALPNVPNSLADLTSYTSEVGKQPNLVEYYDLWGDGFDYTGVKQIYDRGALAYMAWEPYNTSLASIAAGKSDAYITKFAKQVDYLHLPIAISFGHEMNGDWFPWGTTGATPAQFVKAWRRIHDIFQKVGATNVIWVWSPNIVNPVPKVQLAPYYPGDAYVDWIGMIGYYAEYGAHTFDTLYDPTMAEVRAVTKKPFIIAETSSQPESRRIADINDLFAGVESHKDVLGFIWFDIPKRADWRIENTPDALADFKQRASDPIFGFNIRNP